MQLESLKKEKDIALLFKTGLSEYKYPVKILYHINLIDSSYSTVRFAVTAPKKKFPRAVDRNLLKRRLREAFRAQLKECERPDNLHIDLHCILIYTSQNIEDYWTISRSIYKSLNKIFLTEKK